MDESSKISRRQFMKAGAALSICPAAEAGQLLQPFGGDDELNMIGPIPGYSPQIGTLVSMLNYNRATIYDITRGLSMQQLDHLADTKANSIGALLMHLAAVDKWYYINSFEDRYGFNEEEKKIWEIPFTLGASARNSLKGNHLGYYVDVLRETRNQTLKALKEKNDRWLLAQDPRFSKEKKTNNYWKWFHVCEHESNHRGQIAWLKSRQQ